MLAPSSQPAYYRTLSGQGSEKDLYLYFHFGNSNWIGLLIGSFAAEVVIAPPSLYLLLTREHLRKGIEVAAQNVFDKPNGAFTGEISAEQLVDSGIGWTLTGHSERRVIMGEDDNVSRYALGGLGGIRSVTMDDHQGDLGLCLGYGTAVDIYRGQDC